MKNEVTNEIEKCSKDIIYFKDNYLKYLEKITIQDSILKFIADNNIAEINTYRNTYRTTSIEIFILHSLLFDDNKTIGVVIPWGTGTIKKAVFKDMLNKI